MGKKKFFAVRRGRDTGIFESWPETEPLVKGFSHAEFKGFGSKEEALAFLHPNGVVAEEDDAPCAEQLGWGSSEVPTDAPKPSAPVVPTIDPSKRYIMEFDGASRGNPGQAGAGAVVLCADSASVVVEAFQYLGELTNNQSEYRAMIVGLVVAKSLGIMLLDVRGDSKLVCMQVTGRWQVKNEGLAPLHMEACGLLASFKDFTISHVPREQNTIADRLSNIAVDLCGEYRTNLVVLDHQGFTVPVQEDSPSNGGQTDPPAAPPTSRSSTPCAAVGPQSTRSFSTLQGQRGLVPSPVFNCCTSDGGGLGWVWAPRLRPATFLPPAGCRLHATAALSRTHRQSGSVHARLPTRYRSAAQGVGVGAMRRCSCWQSRMAAALITGVSVGHRLLIR